VNDSAPAHLHPLTEPAASDVARQEIAHPTVSSFPDHFRHPRVTFVPIRDLPPMTAGLVWRRADESAAIRALARAATEVVPLL
jgi:hypothetical protein